MVNISAIDVRKNDEIVRISAQISMPDHAGEAWFELPAHLNVDVEGAADAFYTIGLILAMGTDGELRMDAPVSQRLLYSARSIQDIFVGWYPKKVGRINLIDVPKRDVDKPMIQSKTVTCFTGGVDSFDSLINNFDDIDALLYMHGYDIGLHNTPVREATSGLLIEAAKETGKELIQGATNIRVFLNRAATWSTTTHGTALAAVGHLLSGDFGRLLVPASHTYADKYAWGSHPLTDHLWSSNRLSVVHDGAGSTRVQKTKNLAHNVSAQRHLRVCWQNVGKFNCGRCSKCTRTMIALDLSGVLEKFETFENTVPLDDVRGLEITNLSGRSFVVENLDYAREVGAQEIVDVLQELVTTFDKKKTKTMPATVNHIKALKKDIAKLDQRLTKAGKRLAATERELERQKKLHASADGKIRKLESTWPIRTWNKLRGN